MYSTLTFGDPEWARRTVSELEAFAKEHGETLRAYTREGRFPRALYLEMGQRGWVGPITPKRQGGLGAGIAEYCLIEEEVARLGLVSPQVSIQGQRWLLVWGSLEQKKRYLRGVATGELIFSESISEPGVGSSLKLMRATAHRDGDSWIVDGQKTHVNLGAESDLTIFFAMAEEGLTAFLVPMKEHGISTRPTDPIGLRLLPTADVILDSVRLPLDAVLGAPGQGLETFLSTFNISRLGNASELIGFGRRALSQAIDYARDRQITTDSVVTDFQGIQWTVADCYAGLYAAALARDRAATLADLGQDCALETTLAKKLAIDASDQAVNQAFSLVGGHGLYHDTDFIQTLQDMKVLRTAGGSLEVMRNYIARKVLRAPDYLGLG